MFLTGDISDTARDVIAETGVPGRHESRSRTAELVRVLNDVIGETREPQQECLGARRSRRPVQPTQLSGAPRRDQRTAEQCSRTSAITASGSSMCENVPLRSIQTNRACGA